MVRLVFFHQTNAAYVIIGLITEVCIHSNSPDIDKNTARFDHEVYPPIYS
jgi:hypothetical protein